MKIRFFEYVVVRRVQTEDTNSFSKASGREQLCTTSTKHIVGVTTLILSIQKKLQILITTMSTKLNELENATVGMTVGVIEVMCLQPFNYAKNMIQQGMPLSADPRKLYRGVGANCINMGSCTMIQFAVGGSFKKAIKGEDSSRQLKA